MVQSKLGLASIPAYDVRNQCSGFLYGLEMGSALIQSGTYKRILLLGAEVHSTGLDLSTRGRDIAVLFGDGAGSCLLQAADSVTGPAPHFELLGTELHSDGAFVEELWCEHPGSAHFPTRLTEDLIQEAKIFPYMNGRQVFEHAVKAMTEVSLSILKKHSLGPEDVSLLVAHQANLRINHMVASNLGLPDDKVFSTIQDYGNTTAATIPIGMSRAVEDKGFQSGELVLQTVFGSGFTWGAALLRVS